MGSTVAPENAGTLKRTGSGKYFAEFSIGGGQRKGAVLATCTTEEEAKARKLAIARLVGRLRESGHAAMVPNTIRDAGALNEDGMRKLARLVERIAAGKEPGLAQRHTARREGLTVAELADLWTSGNLAEQYPDHVRAKRTSKDDARIFAWLGKVRMPDGVAFGDRAVSSLTLDDCDHVMGALPKTAEAPASRRQYAQSLRKLLVYAVYPLRLLSALPIPKGWLPKGGNDKAKQWVYPSEDLALMQCKDVPLARRVFFGLLVREGLRVSEALALSWTDLDLARESFASTRIRRTTRARGLSARTWRERSPRGGRPAAARRRRSPASSPARSWATAATWRTIFARASSSPT
jgi:integrase